MGGAFSSTTPTTTSVPRAASDPKALGSETPATDSGTLEDKTPKESSESSSKTNAPEESDQLNNPSEEDGEEEGECGFCLFMKGGACREVFIKWENCVQEAGNDNELMMEHCIMVTRALKECMLENLDYYGPVLRAEEAVELKAASAGSKEQDSKVLEKEVEEAADPTNSQVKEGSSGK